MALTTVAVAGSTGSIGTQTIDVVRAEPDRFEIVALGAWSSADALVRQARELRPKLVVVGDERHEPAVREEAPPGTEVRSGEGALAELGAVADVCVNGVVGFAGLRLTLATLAAGRRLALANKESLIAGGPVVRAALESPGAGHVVPVDSEHCAVHQCLATNVSGDAGRVARILLTASGGPFRGRDRAELATVTVDDALAHPTWSMGPKITVDSSTLMNKGLEVIEAHELFGVDYDAIDVVVHPQSIVHSMVELTDGSTIAQLANPDMRLPIGYALAWPDRLGTPFGRLDWAACGRLDFEPPDHEAFPCLGLAYAAGRQGETAPAVLNAANEEAVAAFLGGRIPWVCIPDVLKAVLSGHDGARADGVEAVIDADRRGREAARREIERTTA
ncbi:MAG TPA: 1-deoxy-D-xylulose-5-phosphate reductoisomerase [Acidimicrobiales bacterium]|jgi:1-deoxy-D-xylulose-5-phosphate reductoisomerase|nr:1-deoxy-D-xylulose-5-phosphate reductoisomerase [Acidimicrobiales bacterium]